MNILKRLTQSVVVRNALFMYVVQLSSYILPLLTIPYLSRVLSAETFGLVNYTQIFVYYFVTLTDYGFNLTATREIAKNSDNPEEVSRIFSSVMVAKLLLTITGLLLLLVVVLAVPKMRPNLDLYLISFLMVVGFMLFPLWLYQGLQKMGAIALRDFGAKLFSLVMLVVFVHGDADSRMAAAAPAMGLLLSGVVGLLSVRLKLGVTFQWPTMAAVRDQFKAGFPAFLSLAILAYTFVTNTVLFGLYSPSNSKDIGYFLAGWRIMSAVRMLVTPLSSAIYPYAVKKAMKSEKESLAFTGKYAVWLSAPFVALGIVLLIGAPLLVKFVLGPKFEHSTLALRCLSFSPAVFAAGMSYSTYYMLACGYDKEWMRIVVITVVFNFAMLGPALWLLPGVTGISATCVLPEALGVVLYWRFYRRKKALSEGGS